MKRKDILAAGGKKATFAGGSGETDIFRNVAPEGTRDDSAPIVEPVKITRKKFIPTSGVLLVRRNTVISTSILITETMEKDPPAEGIVLEVGPNITGFPGRIQVGDHIVFGKYAGAEFRLNGETLLLMDATDVKGTIVDEPFLGSIPKGNFSISSPKMTGFNGFNIPGIANA